MTADDGKRVAALLAAALRGRGPLDRAEGATLNRERAALRAAARAVAAGGFIYLEAPRPWTDEELAAEGLSLHRHLKAGAVHAHLLQRG